MIMINEKKIEKALKEVVTYIYGEDPSCYLVLESVKVFTEDEEEMDSYNMILEGRYGREGKAEFEERFEIMIDSNWPNDFIKGLFYNTIMK